MLRTYAEMASGLTELTLARATSAARELVGHGLATAGQVQSIAEDLVRTNRANRGALATLVGAEVDRALGRLGLASADDVDQLAERVRALEAKVRDLGDDVAARR